MSGAPLKRDIGSIGTAFLAFNGMVGAGIFALPAVLAADFGNFSPWLFPIFGLLILAIALPFARLASLFSISGGPVAYVAPFGRMVSFQTGWLYYVARLTALAANANVFAAYAGSLLPALDNPVGRGACIITLVSAMTWVNLVGVRRAIQALDLITLFKLFPLLALAFWALAEAGPPAAGSLPEFGQLEGAALLTLYALIGFENCLVPAGETRDPRKTIPRAMLVTVVATALLYFLIQLAYVSVMPAGAQPEAPLGAMAGLVFGPAGMVILSVTAMISVSGNLLGAITSTPRLTYALSERALLPSWFGKVHSVWATPWNSILFMGALVIILALTGSFVWLAVVSTLSRMFVYAASLAALPGASRAAGQPIGPAMKMVVAAGLAICLWVAVQSELRSWLLLAILSAVGLILYAVAARASRSAKDTAAVSIIQPPPSSREPS